MRGPSLYVVSFQRGSVCHLHLLSDCLNGPSRSRWCRPSVTGPAGAPDCAGFVGVHPNELCDVVVISPRLDGDATTDLDEAAVGHGALLPGLMCDPSDVL